MYFIDDILIFWTGTVKELEDFIIAINQLHPTIKFTANYDILTKSTTFLDTTITIKDGYIITDLYRKPTDKIQYLLPTSCHPSHIFTNIPFSLALRLVRICSTTDLLKKRFSELTDMLISRCYNKNVVLAAIQKAGGVNRSDALKKVVKVKSDRVILAVRYHPCLTSISTTVKTHWNTLIQDPIMKKIFAKPPMLAFKQPPNLRSLLVRAKLATKARPSRVNTGTHQCGKSCKLCSYINPSKEVKSTVTGEKCKIQGDFNCKTLGVIYLVTCKKCNKQYIGQTFRKFCIRMKEHLTDITKVEDKIISTHYNSPGHSIDDFSVQVIEKVLPNSTHILLERERLWILKFRTVIPLGLNSHP